VGPGAYALTVPTCPTLDHRRPAQDRAADRALLDGYAVNPRDPDPRGQPVLDARGKVAGTVVELWLDVPEASIRYLEVEVPQPAAARAACCCPSPSRASPADGQVKVHAVLADAFRRRARAEGQGQHHACWKKSASSPTTAPACSTQSRHAPNR
jgi:hypothetical protein